MLLGSELFLVVGLSDSVGSVEMDGRNETDGTPEGPWDGAALGGCELLGMVLGSELFADVGSGDSVGSVDEDGRNDTDGTPDGELDCEALGGCELLGMLLGSELIVDVGSDDTRAVGATETDGCHDPEGGAESVAVGADDGMAEGALDREGGAESPAVGADDGTAEGGKTISAEGASVGGPVRTGGAVDVGAAVVGGTLGLAVVGLHEICGAVVVGVAVVGLHELCGAFIVGAMVGDPVGKHELCVVVAGLSSCVRPIRLVFVVVEILTAPPGGEGL